MTRLTEMAAACGCAAKLSPQMLEAVLPRLRLVPDPHLLVGFEGADDAAVYQLSPELALVQTVDFFTPIVDEPEDFGAIAAANALSDIYAMGARPLLALSVVGFPPDQPPELLRRILQGGLEVLGEAGCALGGGHSVRDEALKFGYSVTGLVHPARVLRNAGARAGDRLYLTKPLGTGVVTTALKRGQAAPAAVAAAVASMRRLNRAASEAALAAGAHAATDVTGFGLLGHAREMARASGVHLRLRAAAMPLLPGARLHALSAQSQGLHNNQAFAAASVDFAPAVPDDLRALLFDPQTSGGLLLSLPPGARLELADAVEVGAVEPARPGPCLSVE
ncbi:MAG TPA: selenide, water dikinase SelD [Terriglobales bacterium]|nr:selenide, water dikinase SelD [Terriglobales bacterium]